MAKYLNNMYSGNSTDIVWAGHQINNVFMRRGVKQGDPVSPWLFNSIIDELLMELPQQLGAVIGGHHIHAIAYADDIILFAESRFAMNCQLQKVEEFFNARGMKLNANKCISVAIEASGRVHKCAVVSDPVFAVGGGPIRSLGVGEFMRYLGSQLGPSGVLKGTFEATAEVVLITCLYIANNLQFPVTTGCK